MNALLGGGGCVCSGDVAAVVERGVVVGASGGRVRRNALIDRLSLFVRDVYYPSLKR
jgi:hypothetical protein